MGVLVDLSNQVKNILRRINGGTENPYGWSEGVVQRYENNDQGAIALGTIVRLRAGGSSNFVELMDLAEGDSLIGVVTGTYEQFGPNLGAFRASAPSNFQPVAVMTHGTTMVLTEGSITRGYYAYAGSTAGKAKSLAIKRRGAFGRFVSSGSNNAIVRLPLTSIFTGSETVTQYGVERVSDMVTLDFSSGFAIGSDSTSSIASIDLAYEQFELDAAQLKVANSSNYFTANSPSTGIETLRPTSDLITSNMGAITGGATYFGVVDEAVFDGTDYYNFLNNSYIVHGFPSTALTTSKRITSLTFTYYADNNAVANDGFLTMRNPQTGERYDIKGIPQNVSPHLQTATVSTRPWDARPWTVDDLRHLQAGFRAQSPSNLYISQFYCEVNYTNPVTVEQALNQVGSFAASGTHNILSATHGDTLGATVVRGDQMVGNSTPKWARVPIAGSAPSNAVWISNGTDAYWEWPAPVKTITSSSSNVFWGQVDFRAGANVALAASSNTITISATGGSGGGGASLGDWTSYTPTWTTSGTAPSLGNGTLIGRYKALDSHTYLIRIYFSAGSTTTFGTGTWSFALPATTISDGSRQFINGWILDSGTDNKTCSSWIDPNTSKVAEIIPEGANVVTNTVPMTWANGDALGLQGYIEV